MKLHAINFTRLPLTLRDDYRGEQKAVAEFGFCNSLLDKVQ